MTYRNHRCPVTQTQRSRCSYTGWRSGFLPALQITTRYHHDVRQRHTMVSVNACRKRARPHTRTADAARMVGIDLIKDGFRGFHLLQVIDAVERSMLLRRALNTM